MMTDYRLPTCPGCACTLPNGDSACNRCTDTLATWKRVTAKGQDAAEDQLQVMGKHYLKLYSKHEPGGWRIAVAIALSGYGNAPYYNELVAGRGRGLLR